VIKKIKDSLKKNKLMWLIYLLKNRLFFRLQALREGVSLNQSQKSNLYNFRRNIHRLEKGLSFKVLKPSFAEDYIGETVAYLKHGLAAGSFDRDSLLWGVAVLSKYFLTTRHTPLIESAYKVFSSLDLNNAEPLRVPYEEKLRPALNVSYEDLHSLALRRRSIRIYQDKKVEYETVRKAMEIAAFSPSACNRQSFKFLFFNEKTIVKKLAGITGGVAGYDLPSIVVIVGCYRGYFEERDLNAPMVDASLAAMSFLFAAETLGLGTVCINWPSVTYFDQRIRELIHLEKDEFVVMLMGIGYPDPEGKIPFSAKKRTEDLVLNNERIRSFGKTNELVEPVKLQPVC